MNWRKKEKNGVAAVTQLRSGQVHPFGALRGYVPLGTGEEQIYYQMRTAIPVLDAAVGKLVRLSGGFEVKCRNQIAQEKLNQFLKTVPCGRGQFGIGNFLSGYLDSLLTYGRAVGEMVVSDGKLRAVCWGDVTRLEIHEGESPLDMVLWGPDERGLIRPLPYQQLLLFTTMNPEPGSPYGVSIFRGMPFLADILMKIYQTVGTNWERAGNVRYSVICKGEHYDGQLCCGILKEPMDAYEFSFVAVPAQPNAGVLKGMGTGKRSLKELADSFGAQAEYRALYKEAELGRQYKKQVQDDVVRLCLSLELGAEEPVLRSVMEKAAADDLLKLRKALEERFAESFPTTTQLGGTFTKGNIVESEYMI